MNIIRVAWPTILFLPCFAWAGTTGKIAGRVLDAETNEPLAYANVVVEGTGSGAATDDHGRFSILNIVPGIYSVRADYLGYARTTLAEVRVNIDHTTRIVFQLNTDIIELEGGTVVIADREYFQKDLTASQSVVGAKQIETTPATELGDLLELQAGVTTDAGGALHFRGGRSGEVAFLVDGVSFTDPFTGGQAVAVENGYVQELQVISGAFNAEYGQAMSGVVNIVTKEGGSQWSGSISNYFGDYISRHSELFWAIDELSPAAVRNLQGSLSGPLLGDKLTLFASGRAVGSDGYLYGREVFNFHDVADFSDPDPENWRVLATGDSSFVSMNPYRKYSGQAKLVWRLTPGLKLRYNLLLENSKSDSYDHFFRYNPYATPTYRKTGTSHTLTGTLAFGASARTFLHLGLSRFVNHQESWVFEDRSDPRYYYTAFLDQVPNYGYSYSTGGVSAGWWQQETITDIVKLDLTSQLNHDNLVKLGVELRHHDFDVFNQSIADGKVGSPFVETFAVQPTEFSAYVQNKLEIEDLILNTGVRIDRFDPAADIPFDPRDPNVANPLRSFFDHSSGRIVGFADGRPVYEGGSFSVPWDDPAAADLRSRYMFTAANPKHQISPRVGLSYPITDRGGIHVSYGHFFQIPTLATIYSNPEWLLGDGIGITSLMGNPDIDAQKTVQYEIGLQQQIGDAASSRAIPPERNTHSTTTEIKATPGEWRSRSRPIPIPSSGVSTTHFRSLRALPPIRRRLFNACHSGWNRCRGWYLWIGIAGTHSMSVSAWTMSIGESRCCRTCGARPRILRPSGRSVRLRKTVDGSRLTTTSISMPIEALAWQHCASTSSPTYSTSWIAETSFLSTPTPEGRPKACRS